MPSLAVNTVPPAYAGGFYGTVTRHPHRDPPAYAGGFYGTVTRHPIQALSVSDGIVVKPGGSHR